MTKRDNSMQLRAIAIIISIVGFWYSSLAVALGLGEINLKSQFNQPLNAEIRLLKVRDLSESDILVSLAAKEDFTRVGVDRIFFLTGMKFEVVLDTPSNPFIRVTTRQPVTEPYLDFLLDVQWPSGRILREYTLLLDLPVFSEAAPVSAPAAPSASAPAQPQYSAPAAVAQPAPSSPVVSSSPPSSTPQETYSTEPQTSSPDYSAPAPVDNYRVRSGDTLWEIAERVRPDSSVTVNQTMIAIQQSNPGAFIDDNINLLRNGRVLRIPTRTEISDISYNQAIASVKQQNQAWSETQSQKAVLTSAAPSASDSSAGTQPEGRLTLGSADSGQSSVQGSGLSGGGESLQNDLAIAQEELNRSQRENSDLQARVADLEAQIETMEQLVNVTNDQLKKLELATQTDGSQIDGTQTDSTAADSVQTDSVTSDTDTVSADPTEIVSDTQDAETADTSEVIPAESTVVAEPVPVEPVVPVVEEAETGNKFIELLKRNAYAFGGGLLALLIAIFLLLRLRERSDEVDFDDFELDEEDDLFAEDQSDEFDEEQALDSDEVEDDHEAVEAQTEDVVAEADIYVSLGQEDKAIELLETEIQQNPDNADARLGILRIHAKAQDATAFDEQYAQLLPQGDANANRQATELRSTIAGIESFDTEQYSPEEAGIEAAAEELAEHESGEELDLDLDLDLGMDENDFASSLDEAGDDLNLDSDELDFDLELDDLDLDLGDLNEGLNELDVSDDESTDEETLELEVDEDLSFDEIASNDLDLDLEEDALDLSETTLDIDDDFSKDLSDLEVGELSDEDVDSTVTELDLDIDDDFAKSLGELDDEDISINLEDDDAGDDLSLDFESSVDDDADSLGLEENDELGSLEEFELDLDEPEDFGSDELGSSDVSSDEMDFNLGLDDEAVEENPSESLAVADSLDLDLPPRDDLDIASLDEEIDAMTAALDDTLPLDKKDDEVDLDFELDLDESDVEELSQLDTDEEVLEDLNLDTEDLDSLAEDEESALEQLASTEIDESEDSLAAVEEPLAVDEGEEPLTTEESIDDLDDETMTVASASDEVSITDDEELDFLEASDEVATKLDLAKAYLDMGDREGAEDILGEVMEEGNSEQKQEAQELMSEL